jgi:MFS family permease
MSRNISGRERLRHEDPALRMSSASPASAATALPWYRQVNATQWRAFWATFLGWVLDGFDFTIITFILIDIQNSFTVDRALAGALGTVTLVMRFVGGALAGTAADRWGRRLPLMLSILWFSLFAALSGFSTSYAMLFTFRALFGIGMGGEWAAGMPLVLEHWPARLRGIASGLLQGGYSWGFILSAIVFTYIYPRLAPFGDVAWRAMFWLGILPALLVLWIRRNVEESPVWLERRKHLVGARRKDTVSLLRIFHRDLLPTTIQSSVLIGSFMSPITRSRSGTRRFSAKSGSRRWRISLPSTWRASSAPQCGDASPRAAPDVAAAPRLPRSPGLVVYRCICSPASPGSSSPVPSRWGSSALGCGESCRLIYPNDFRPRRAPWDLASPTTRALRSVR